MSASQPGKHVHAPGALALPSMCKDKPSTEHNQEKIVAPQLQSSCTHESVGCSNSTQGLWVNVRGHDNG